MEYEAFQKWYLSKDKEAKNYRLAGKLLNLSCQYRIGTSALKRKFFETYGIIISQGEAHHYLKLYKSRYSGVVDWWDKAIKFARENGHARTLADRRYRIDQWSSNKWQSESSAINTPVQGSAADHKELTLYLMSVKFPEAKFFLDIHDELCFYVPRDMEFVKEFAHTISNLTEMYNNIWDTKLPIELPFDSVLCKENFKDGIDVL
jgi:DNA polymerase I-like protein with 3'-5' exonuclease and polymerase domains